MAELKPEMGALGRAGFGESSKGSESAFIVQDDVPWPFEVPTVYLNISRKQEAGPRPSPSRVEGFESRRHLVVRVGQTFAHGGFTQAVGQRCAAGEDQRLGERMSHGAVRSSRIDRGRPSVTTTTVVVSRIVGVVVS
jgi:hypothetical protein